MASQRSVRRALELIHPLRITSLQVRIASSTLPPRCSLSLPFALLGPAKLTSSPPLRPTSGHSPAMIQPSLRHASRNQNTPLLVPTPPRKTTRPIAKPRPTLAPTPASTTTGGRCAPRSAGQGCPILSPVAVGALQEKERFLEYSIQTSSVGGSYIDVRMSLIAALSATVAV